MAERKMQYAQAAQSQMDTYVRTTASSGSGSAADQIVQAKGLLDNGTITQAEFDGLKAKALAA
jgi:hypothetical protein